MSEQRVPPEVRHAIWLAHKGRCPYCSEPMAFAESDIDHVVPESVATSPAAFARVKAELGLPLDFQVQSLRNLLPAHRRCNRLKAMRKFAPAPLALFLRMAQDAEEKIIAILSQSRRNEAKDKLLIGVARAIREGVIMPSELLDPSHSPEAIVLKRPLRFYQKVVDRITAEEVHSLLDEPVFGLQGMPFYSGSLEDDRIVYVNTCREYRNAITSGFYPRTTHDIKVSAQLSTIDAVLSAAEKMRIPKASFISAPHKGVADLDLLPVEVLPVVSPDDPAEIASMAGQTLADLLGRGEIKITSCSSEEIILEWHWGLVLRELCRSDLDGDGLEDILCECYCWAPGGSLGYGWNALLSRTSAEGLFKFKSL